MPSDGSPSQNYYNMVRVSSDNLSVEKKLGSDEVIQYFQGVNNKTIWKKIKLI